jgi:hypothetical protein
MSLSDIFLGVPLRVGLAAAIFKKGFSLQSLTHFSIK